MNYEFDFQNYNQNSLILLIMLNTGIEYIYIQIIDIINLLLNSLRETDYFL